MAENVFNALCIDCPQCGTELVPFLAYSFHKHGVNSPETLDLQCTQCGHVWRPALNLLALRQKSRAEIDARGGPEVFSYK